VDGVVVEDSAVAAFAVAAEFVAAPSSDLISAEEFCICFSSDCVFSVTAALSEASPDVPAAEVPDAQEVIKSVTGRRICRKRRADFMFISVFLLNSGYSASGFIWVRF
jgi:hypothetical protein